MVYYQGKVFKHAFISEILNHDSQFVNDCLFSVLNLKNFNFSQIRNLFFWFDAGGHFRNGHVLRFISELSHCRKVSVNYFIARHGKNICDCFFSEISRYLKTINDQKRIRNTKELIDELNKTKTSTLSLQTQSQTQTQTQFHFYDREKRPNTINTIKIDNIKAYHHFSITHKQLHILPFSFKQGGWELSIKGSVLTGEPTLPIEYKHETKVERRVTKRGHHLTQETIQLTEGTQLTQSQKTQFEREKQIKYHQQHPDQPPPPKKKQKTTTTTTTNNKNKQTKRSKSINQSKQQQQPSKRNKTNSNNKTNKEKQTSTKKQTITTKQTKRSKSINQSKQQQQTSKRRKINNTTTTTNNNKNKQTKRTKSINKSQQSPSKKRKTHTQNYKPIKNKQNILHQKQVSQRKRKNVDMVG